ncbi:MAG: methyltransferase domain-containing protein [Candidatus Omnitrophica bacterium]|nr:methyltransferase domain-containing protein [Candidatus Omnitrophota bacterium]MDD5237762.1 methyltransferase domain-containing protein [Candidatus Omnitrophota bacterium]
MTFNSQYRPILDLLVCPECKVGLRAQEDKLICSNCNSEFTGSNGIYNMIGGQLNEHDLEQQRVADETCAGYHKFLTTRPLYGLIRDKYVFPYWLKDSFDGKSILDIGSGTGWSTCVIAARASMLVNLDISLERLRFAKARLEAQNVIYVQGDMKKTPFPDKKFDIILSYGSLHHLDNPETAIAEIGRVMNKNGVFLAIEPNIKFTWVEFWNEILHLPKPLEKRITNLYKVMQKYTKKQLEKEQPYLKNIKSKEKLHEGIRDIDWYKNMFAKFSFKLEYQPVGLEMVPPRLLMSKNIILVESLLKCSQWCINRFKKGKNAYFNIMRATRDADGATTK